jgi:hypothetical protein
MKTTGFGEISSGAKELKVQFKVPGSIIRFQARFIFSRWLALTRPGLSPGKKREASLGALTPRSAKPVERERNRLPLEHRVRRY